VWKEEALPAKTTTAHFLPNYYNSNQRSAMIGATEGVSLRIVRTSNAEKLSLSQLCKPIGKGQEVDFLLDSLTPGYG